MSSVGTPRDVIWILKFHDVCRRAVGLAGLRRGQDLRRLSKSHFNCRLRKSRSLAAHIKQFHLRVMPRARAPVPQLRVLFSDPRLPLAAGGS